MEYNDLQADIRKAYAAMKEHDEKETKRLAEIERGKRCTIRDEMMRGARMPKCRCLSCVTSICLLQEPDSRKCESVIRPVKEPKDKANYLD